MPAPKRTIRRSGNDAHAFLQAYWRGDPPPKSAPSAADRDAYLNAYFFYEDRDRFARELGLNSYAASGLSAVDHPHHHAWSIWSDVK